MPTTAEKIKQLAPHWAVMFLVMFLILFVVEATYGELSFWQSVLLVVIVAFGYPSVVRYLGVAPEVWASE